MDAPRGSVEFEGTDELQRLRRRAYGPDADIAGDAVAQARLSELEATKRRELTLVVDAAARGPAAVSEPVPVSEPVEGPRPASTSVPQPVDGALSEQDPAGGSATGQHPAEGSIADSGPIDGPPAAPWWRRRRWLAILGGAIAALALIATGAWMSQLLADGPTPTPTETATAEMPLFPTGFAGFYVPAPDYVLALKSVGEDADASIDPNGFLDRLGISADDVRRYEDFQGPYAFSSTVWSGESRFGITCLFVGPEGQETGHEFSYPACSLTGMDIIMDAGLGRDSLTRFVLRGDRVHVYVYEGATDPNASQG